MLTPIQSETENSRVILCHFIARHCSSIRKWQLKIYLALAVRQVFIPESVSSCLHTRIDTFSEGFTLVALLYAPRNAHCHFFSDVSVRARLVGICVRSWWTCLASRALPLRQLNWLWVLIYSGQHWRRTTAKRKSWCCCGNAAADRHKYLHKHANDAHTHIRTHAYIHTSCEFK